MVEYLPSKQTVAGSSPVYVTTIMGSDQLKAKRAITDSNARGPSNFTRTQMHNEHNTNARKRPTKYRKVTLNKDTGQKALISAVIPEALNAKVNQAIADSGLSLSDIVRRGLIREVGAIALAKELKLSASAFGTNDSTEIRYKANKVDKEAKDTLQKLRALLK